ncbi:manganese efflux pump MntP family protein [Phocaeicola sp.]|uniref:manganese efflux pump MntP n=1 Tax=Phocaeicola sp. TaxID=2773926 RepID=UPI0023D64CC2|nr:manganese efflux pump MntP family protein [Phocaeicola sp.]MDE5678215.1 manganese efflux pump MntP family protein [Phocaeicola sp.]
MTTFEIWLLAISLAMDCFTVSITSGIIMRRICWRTFGIIAFFFGLFQAAMPVIGWFSATRFRHLIESYDHWIAFGLLAFLGGRMIKEGFADEDTDRFDPTRLKVIITLAIATSIDALAIGISFAFVGMNSFISILSPITIIGFTSFIFSLAGSLIGVFCGKQFNLRMEVWGGLVLIFIGTKILIEHLFLS